ncbi:hypothetical protein A2U01_0030426 [Trifolium medium]|uniref:Uncharacterized protein n=1 Tax=Trifolium medium TaxID=97028 RepID=A0A392PD03_9FABA|nr:hypothetical protein [Trifolium medium]
MGKRLDRTLYEKCGLLAQQQPSRPVANGGIGKEQGGIVHVAD